MTEEEMNERLRTEIIRVAASGTENTSRALEGTRGAYPSPKVNIALDPNAEEGVKLTLTDEVNQQVEVYVVDPDGNVVEDLMDKLQESELIHVSTTSNFGTIGHVSSGRTLLIDSLTPIMANAFENMEVRISDPGEGPPVPSIGYSRKGTRPRGSALSPAKRLLLRQQEKRKKG